PAKELISRRKARDFADHALIVTDDSDWGATPDESPVYYGLNGQAIGRTILDSGGGVDPDHQREYAVGLLEEHRILKEEQIRLDHYEIVPVAGGSIIRPGDV